MEKFDVIVIGAGPAGSIAGYLLAKAGLSVLIVERGQTPGSKNLSGGLLYSTVLKELFPDSWAMAPIERAITSHRVIMLGDRSSVSLDFLSEDAAQRTSPSYSVLRAKFDPWLAKQAEETGATLVTGVTVDSLLVQNGRVLGVKAGSDEICAHVVVVAEGTRSLLLKQAGLREEYFPHDVSLGVKEVIALPPQTLEERFQCTSTTGTACTLVGHTAGIEGGGFIYTNKASLSVGVVVKISSLCERKLQPQQVLDEFTRHPLVMRLIEGGEVIEYSAQTVHRGEFHLASRLYGDGYVVAGSAARLLLNNIMTLRGMDFAVVSAASAAKAILAAKEKGVFDSTTLSAYKTHLENTSIYRDWRTYKDVYRLMDNRRLFEVYPDIACDVMETLFRPTSQPTPKILGALRAAMQGRVSTTTLARDLYHLVRGVVL